MRRGRRRIVCCRRRTCLIDRALVKRLRWRIGHIRPWVHPLRRPLECSLRRSLESTLRRADGWARILCTHWARRIDTRQVGAPRTRALCRPRESAAQHCARSRRCAPGCGKRLRTNVGSANRRNGASIPIQGLLVVRSRHRSVVERPRPLGNRSTINHDQAP
jgi:hypothetical protein